jgi:UDP-N-acetylglucosamine 4-epimerase
MSATRRLTTYEILQRNLPRHPARWLVTGAAGFIGSNLVEALLKLDQRVIGLDNFATGHRRNLVEVRGLVTRLQWARFKFLEGDLCDLKACRRACRGVDFVLHQAALGSVPRSVKDPLESHASNVTGFLQILLAARDAGVKRFVYASSSSVYGDDPRLPKVEEVIGRPLSPYATTKRMNEFYAEVFATCYGVETIGLRYFNVFGPRQDPDGPYAAVIPKWVAALIGGEPVWIHGDGRTSRDFCYVANAVQANLLAATTQNRAAVNQVYNIALGQRTTLNELFVLLRDRLTPHHAPPRTARPIHQAFRAGDVRHSQADIRKARRLLGYRPTDRIDAGLDAAISWYRRNLD